jgi:hypothetical protein
VDLYLDEWLYELLEVIERTRARRVFIDSLGDLRRGAVDKLRSREYLYTHGAMTRYRDDHRRTALVFLGSS